MGKGVEVKSEPCRRSVKAFGAVSVEDKPRFHFGFADRFNAKSFLTSLKRVVRCHPGRKVFAVLDNVGYHHARLVKDWVEQNKSRIELHFLPAYSPQFNPMEIVWRQAKRAAAHNRHFGQLTVLHSKLFRRFNRFQGNPSSLRTIVTKWRLCA